jgi:hypothetical protein
VERSGNPAHGSRKWDRTCPVAGYRFSRSRDLPVNVAKSSLPAILPQLKAVVTNARSFDRPEGGPGFSVAVTKAPHCSPFCVRFTAQAVLSPLGLVPQVGWEAAKERAGVTCRFQDLRHTGCTRMREGGVPFSVMSDVMGWSASTAVRRAKRYGHIGHTARLDAVNKLSAALLLRFLTRRGAQKWTQWRGGDARQVR